METPPPKVKIRRGPTGVSNGKIVWLRGIYAASQTAFVKK
mgnify:CR=1 FL=1